MLRSTASRNFWTCFEMRTEHLTRSASDYGLSLILGGGKAPCWTSRKPMRNYPRGIRMPIRQTTSDRIDVRFPLKDKMAIWYTFDALKGSTVRTKSIEIDLFRQEGGVEDRHKLWVPGCLGVGVTPDYAIGVWTGNAQGQGVPGLTGARTAGPVMFDLFNLLPQDTGTSGPYARNGWFLEPMYGDYMEAEVCSKSASERVVLRGDRHPPAVPKAIKTSLAPTTGLSTENGCFSCRLRWSGIIGSFIRNTKYRDPLGMPDRIDGVHLSRGRGDNLHSETAGREYSRRHLSTCAPESGIRRVLASGQRVCRTNEIHPSDASDTQAGKTHRHRRRRGRKFPLRGLQHCGEPSLKAFKIGFYGTIYAVNLDI